MRLPRIAIVIMSSAVVVITSISMNAFSLFLTPIESAFGWSRTTATIPYVFAMLGWGVGGVLFGKKADDLGTRPVILGGILLMAAGFFGMGLSQNLWQLCLTFGIMTGMAKGACGLVIISLLVAKHYDANSRGLAVSIVQTASPLSPFFLAPLLYFLIGSYDWRVAAMACGVLLLVEAFPFGWIGARDPGPLFQQAARARDLGELSPLPAGPHDAAAVRGAISPAAWPCSRASISWASP